MEKPTPYQTAGKFLKATLCQEDDEMSWKIAMSIEQAVIEKDKEYLQTLLDDLIEFATNLKKGLDEQ